MPYALLWTFEVFVPSNLLTISVKMCNEFWCVIWRFFVSFLFHIRSRYPRERSLARVCVSVRPCVLMSAGCLKIWRIWFGSVFFLLLSLFPFSFLANIAQFVCLFFTVSLFYAALALGSWNYLRSPTKPACNFIHRIVLGFFALSSAIVAMCCSFVASSAFGRRCFVFSFVFLSSSFGCMCECAQNWCDLEQFQFRIVYRLYT